MQRQIKFFKKNVKLNKIKKNDIIFWKGHVAVALSNKAYSRLWANEENGCNGN